MLVVLMSNRCFHCIHADFFVSSSQVADYVEGQLIGSACPLCTIVVQRDDFAILIDSGESQAIKDGKSYWNRGGDPPDAYKRFFSAATSASPQFGGVAALLREQVLGSAAERRRVICRVGTQCALPYILLKARQAQEDGQNSGARAAYRICVELGDALQVVEAAFSLGKMDEEEGDLVAAARWYRLAAESEDPVFRPIACFFLGCALGETGDLEGARLAYQRCVDCGDSIVRGPSAYRLGTLLHHQRDISGARRAYEFVVKLRDSSHSAEAAVHLGVLDEADRRWAKAKSWYEYAFASGSEPARTVAAFNLGRIWEYEGHPRKAKEFYRIATGSTNQETANRARVYLSMLE